MVTGIDTEDVQINKHISSLECPSMCIVINIIVSNDKSARLPFIAIPYLVGVPWKGFCPSEE